MIVLTPSRAAREYGRREAETLALWPVANYGGQVIPVSPPRRLRWLREQEARIEAGERRLWTAERWGMLPRSGIGSAAPFRRCYAPPAAAAAHVYANKAIHVAAAAGDYLTISNAAFTNDFTSGFTAAFWLKADDALAAYVSLFHNGSTQNGWYFRTDTTPNMVFTGVNGVTGGTHSTPNVALSSGAWHLVVGGWDGQNAANKVYLSVDNSNYVGTVTDHVNTTAGALEVARQGGGTLQPAAFDSMAYWSRFLTQTEVALLWNSGVGLAYWDVANVGADAGLLTSLKAWWDCDDTGGQNLVDASGAGLTLLGQNGASTYTSVAGVR